jgi:hypothetical protein
MDALRETALAEHADVLEPDILNFHREVSIHRTLRQDPQAGDHAALQAQEVRPAERLERGVRMLAKRKLDLTFPGGESR